MSVYSLLPRQPRVLTDPMLKREEALPRKSKGPFTLSASVNAGMMITTVIPLKTVESLHNGLQPFLDPISFHCFN